MLFCSYLYIIFLSIILLLYWKSPQRFRVPLLLLASYVFYMSWSPPFGLIYGPVIFIDSVYFYTLSKLMLRWPDYKKPILILGVTSELCLLGYFKYANFIVGNVEGILSTLHLPSHPIELHIFLPLAISFTTFVLISYLIDVYRGAEKAEHGFTRFAAYVAFFPHLIAGPIVRAKELLHQFDSCPKFDWERFGQGVNRFAGGLFIKVFVADVIALYVNAIYGNAHLQGFDTSWLATYGFAIQIFCDFAGYTRMAQGSALMMGYTLPENFDAPYFSSNVSEFWRRWHMTLSRWLKDYLYVPLGGSRCSKLKTYRNLFITMGLGGLWHGASWNFVIWGLYHGLLLSLHKLGEYLKINPFIPKIVSIFLTFNAVCIGWVFFRAKTFPQAFHILATMFNPLTARGLSDHITDTIAGSTKAFTSETALYIILIFFFIHWFLKYHKDRFTHPWIQDYAMATVYCTLIYFGITMVQHTEQFIYFQF